MASTSSNTTNTATSLHKNINQPSSPNTTFVQADPYSFRTIVQKLTGAPDDPSIQKLPLTNPTRPATTPGPKRPAFKLQERRQISSKNLQINLNNNNRIICCSSSTNNNSSFDNNNPADMFQVQRHRGSFLVSPVSTLDFFGSRVGPRSPCEEEEERAVVAEKGFYLHPISPLSTPRGGAERPPELLPLFPLRSPRDYNDDEDHDNDDECN